jgi:hypothetical protein
LPGGIDLQEWLFCSQTGEEVGVINSLGVGSGVGLEKAAKKMGVDFLLSVFCIILEYCSCQGQENRKF